MACGRPPKHHATFDLASFCLEPRSDALSPPRWQGLQRRSRELLGGGFKPLASLCVIFLDGTAVLKPPLFTSQVL